MGVPDLFTGFIFNVMGVPDLSFFNGCPGFIPSRIYPGFIFNNYMLVGMREASLDKISFEMEII